MYKFLVLSLLLSAFSGPLHSQVDSEALSEDVQQLYIGILGRAADQPGLDYWVNEIESGQLTLENTRASFTQQVEYTSIYEGLDNSALVTSIYQNFLERDPDDAGLAYWVAELDAGNVNPDQLVNALVNAVEDPESSSDQALIDKSVLINKVSVAEYFTGAFSEQEVNDSFISAAQNAVADVDADAGSVDVATAGVDSALTTFIEEAANSPWVVNSDATRSQYIFEDGSNQGVLVNVQSVSDSTVESILYTYVEATGIPDYAVRLTAADLNGLNDRPQAATDFSSGSTIATVGELIAFGQDIGYLNNNNQNCSVDAGYGYWPPGPECPTNQGKEGYFPQQPVVTEEECETGLGAIGYAVNGVSIYNWGDGQSYNSAGVWQTLAPFAEVYDVDLCGGHSAAGDYHHHFYAACWGETAGDDGEGHSEVLGFAADGYAVYGPWFDTAVLANSCWVERDYSASSVTGGGCDDNDRSCTLNNVYDITEGTTPVTDEGNTPSLTGSYTSLSGNVFATGSGFFKEDYYYDSTCASTGGENLDQFNGHDHDDLGYHYHVTVSSDDNVTPTYPFTIGPKFKGELSENSVSSCSGSSPGGTPPPRM